MLSVGVPTVPGSEGLLASAVEAADLASQMGYPGMIKATAGGGGRGMLLVNKPDQLETLFKAAQGEAEAAFGNAGVCNRLCVSVFSARSVSPPDVQVQIQVRGLDAAAQNHPRPARTGCRVQVFQQHGLGLAMGHT